MARPLRLEYPGAVYYLASEGNGGETVFRSDEDRRLFLDTVEQACLRLHWEVLAFRLEPRRFELVVRTPEPNLVTGMKWLLGAFTIKYNRKHQRRGHLLAGRYRSVLVEDAAPYLPAAVDFVHLNVAKTGMPEKPEAQNSWCSLRYYVSPPVERPGWLNVRPIFEYLHLSEDDAGRARYAARLRSVAGAPPAQMWALLRRGWRMGSDAFRAGLVQRLRQTQGNSAQPGRMFAREQADLLVKEELARLGWTEAELSRRPKGDPEKVRIAKRLRAETAASLRWVAARLHMGAWTSAANLIYRKEVKAPRVRRVQSTSSAAADSVPAQKISETLPAEPVVPPDDLPVHCL